MNELQKLQAKQMREVGQLYNPTITAIMDHLANGETVAVAVNKGFKDASYEAALSDVTVGNTVSASGLGLGEQLTLNLNLAPDYFLFTQFANGVTLSDTIHSGEAQKAVKAVLNDYFKFKGNAQELTKKLTNINRFPNVDIPREIKELVRLSRGVGAAKDTREFQKQVNRALSSIKGLDARKVTQTRDLKKAYTKLISTIQKGTPAQVNKALEFAFNKKVNYINSMIARTEFKRSYDMSIARQIEEDPLALGYYWTLSSDHPRADFCDVLATADSYGGGAGWFPQGHGADSHVGCLCGSLISYKEVNNPRYSQERVNAYLESMSERDRRATIGAKDSQFKKDWGKGLAKKGYTVKKARMINKSILKKVE